MNIGKMNLMDMVLSFTTAMDSVSTELQNHHKRVTNIAANIAVQMGLPEYQIFDIILAARLHDIGAISILERKHLMDLSFDANYNHAIIGYRILQDFPLFGNASKIILYHHRSWRNGKNKFDGNGNEIPMGSWIIHLADRVDVSMKHSEYPLGQKKIILEKLAPHFDTVFHPDVVSAFIDIAEKESFWLDVNFSRASNKYQDIFVEHSPIITGNTIVDFSKSFSKIIDFRNKFTSTHSAGVSASAAGLTRIAGFDEIMQKKMRTAGFLHDLGKIVIPIEILEKNGPLDYNERLIINSHTYHTYNILSHVRGLEEINKWASFHHEKLDGSGYPFRLTGESLDTMSRIMMLADIFTALTECRPYREGMKRPEVEKIITEWVKDGKLDKDLSELLLSNYNEMDEERKDAQADASLSYGEAVVKA